MKKTLLILAMALLIALPALGLATDLPAPTETEAPAATETEAPAATNAPLGRQYGRRWQQANPEAAQPSPGFVDENKDGICDNCGTAEGQNPQAPGFVDENKDGVCDHYGTDEQRQNQGQRRHAGMRGRGMQKRSPMGQQRGRQGSVQGPNWADANGDGICDNFRGGRQGQGGQGRGRNRR